MTMETIDGYEEDRHPRTQVSIAKGKRGDTYHEIDENGDIACTERGNSEYKIVSLKKAIAKWKEPCQRPACKRFREQPDRNPLMDGEDDSEGSSSPYIIVTGWRDAEQLERAYWDYYWSTNDIADWVGTSHQDVLTEMDRLGIPRRNGSESQKVRWMKERGASPEAIGDVVPHPSIEKSKEKSERVNWSRLQEE